MLGLYVVLAVVVLGLVIGVATSLKFERDIVRQKREEEDARIKEELSKQEQKRAPRMEEEKQSTAQSDDEEKLKWWYANMNMNLDEGAVECGFNMLQLYFASVNGTSKPFKKKLNQLTRLNRYYK
jgi:hypothetical protein